MQNVSIFVVDIIKQTNEILQQIKRSLLLNPLFLLLRICTVHRDDCVCSTNVLIEFLSFDINACRGRGGHGGSDLKVKFNLRKK